MMDSRPGDAFQPGDVLSNTYRIEVLLGRGGTSDVYKARSEISGRLAALKVLKSEFSGNDDYLVLLTREEEIREVRHDAVVRYSENHRTQDGLVYLVMDYVEGPGLDKKLKQGPMSADDLLTICRRVSEGLEAAHQRNIVHRDLSPDNIILRGGDPAGAVIIDFGIAKDTNPGAETIVGNEFAGKYAYAAPEQLSGETDARSDIYSLGALLLANFRGEKPDIGSNPMEVVRKKGEPLDTGGLPEPLKELIDRMTAPLPADRFQSAAEVLGFLKSHSDAGQSLDPDATVIVPPPRTAEPAPAATPKPDPVTAPKPAPAPPASVSGAPAKKSRSGLIAALVLLVAVGGGIGAYVSGMFEPAHPLAAPFTLSVSKPKDGAASAVGFVPSEQTQAALSDLMADQSGSADLTLATGDVAESWGTDVLATLNKLAPLQAWQLSITDNTAMATGTTTDAALHNRLTTEFLAGFPGALEGAADITLEKLFLPVAELTPVLEQMADCGPLDQPDATPVGYGPGSDIVVTGKLAGTATRVQLFDALSALAGDRNVVLDLAVLNPTLCLIENYLPDAPTGGIGVDFTVGDRDEPNPSGRFFVGENPVIDVVLPAGLVDGYLTVSILDVSGNVFHLLPNINRPDNSVAALRAGRTGDVDVRVAYSIAEATGSGGIAFQVDDSTLGKSKVIVIYSAKPLFDGMRPTSESAVGYAEALQANFEADRNSIQSLDSRILVTAAN